jgi:xanthine dehydrogenase accessory factor
LEREKESHEDFPRKASQDIEWSRMKNLHVHLYDILKKNRQVALATIIEAKGSTPQVSGASAIFSSDRLVAGTLGGGLLEGDAQRIAQAAIKEKQTVIHGFNLHAGLSEEDGAVCGGNVTVLIDALPKKFEETFQRLHQSLLKKLPGILATRIRVSAGKHVSITRYWIEAAEPSLSGLDESLSGYEKDVSRVFFEERPVLLRLEEEVGGKKENYLFLEPIIPWPQLVIAGAGHVGRAVAHLGSLLDFEVTIIDDRPEFANKENIPDADHIVVDHIDKALKTFIMGSDTYLVIVTRGHRQDAEALRACIHSGAAYIGMIGSVRKVKLMREKFLEKGWAAAAQFDRVHAPIGLDIGSQTVEEIAISIAAQLVHVRSQIHEKRKRKG